jgi:hypothetical protein
MFTTDGGDSAIAFLNLPDWWLAGGLLKDYFLGVEGLY